MRSRVDKNTVSFRNFLNPRYRPQKIVVMIISESNTKIANAQNEDVGELATFSNEEFTRTFGHLYKKEDLDACLADYSTPQMLLDWINDSNYFIQIARNESNSIVGYIICGKCGLPGIGDTTNYGEIKRLYIHPSEFGKGTAHRLMTAAMSWLKTHLVPKDIYLGVYSENYRAQAFYAKYHFVKVAEYGYPVGEQVDLEFIFKHSPLSPTDVPLQLQT